MSTTKELREKVYERSMNAVPAAVAARVDIMRPSFAASWGGPMNGQHHRREIVREIARSGIVDRVVETGTYRGTTTEFLSAVFGVPIDTVEANDRFHRYSSRRLANDPSISTTLGDSRTLLRRLAATTGGDTVFVYLDAHWENDLPLAEELEIIAATWARAIVMIDDFEVPGDSGYGFDDYGPGAALTASYLPPAVSSWLRLYPALGSAAETGHRRGCCVLVSPGVAPDLSLTTVSGVPGVLGNAGEADPAVGG